MQIRRAIFGFCLVASLQWTLVSQHPLGLESRGVVGIHQRQPSYLPTYNGIFSIHALNFTAPSDAPHLHPLSVNTSLSIADQEDGDDRLVSSDDQEHNLLAEDGTAANEVDSGDEPKVLEQTTFPQLHVVTQTIGDITTGDWEQTAKEIEVEIADAQNETTTENDHTGSETLLEGIPEDSEDSSEDSEDIFDRLMRTIQGHWLDFVGKMKLSVLDVWKSISHHMMERLESFATGL